MYEVSAPSNEVTAGCTWSETDWSCAYDTVFMVILDADLTTMIAASQVLPTICDHNAWEALIRDSLVGNPKASLVSTQAWVNFFLQGQKMVSSNCHLLPPCQECGEATEVWVFFDDPPPLITFEVVIDSLPSILGSPTLALPTILGQAEYCLRGIIYKGAFHFSARMLDPKGVVWQYDDRVNDGHPSFDLAATDHQRCSPTFDYKTLKMLQGRAAHLLIYMLC
ncbi:hypothetical protein BD769DRAFT_1389791 [Suillus cothurnatus]|nr:hypothetical protein BD769DRAFT_1389791 [Suillus cothurnatus]